MVIRQSQAMADPAHAVHPAKPSRSAPIHRSASKPKMGNQAAQRLLRDGVIQAKLSVNQPGDRFEQEADRIAEAVVRLPDPAATAGRVSQTGAASSVQRTCTCGKPGGESGMCEGCEGSSVATTAPPIVHEVVRSSGRPLDAAVRSFMEPRFGHDFSGVRVHTDSNAAQSASSVNALAYTVGRDIVFNSGQYNPTVESGRRILAHELTHVIQQGFAPLRTTTRQPPPIGIASPAAAQSLQRFSCDLGSAPGMSCNDVQRTARPAGVNLEHFDINAHRLKPAHITAIAAFKRSWDAAGSRDDVEVHGYASCDGPADRNVQLSCDRAEAVKAELVRRGITTSIRTLAHGETDEFGPSLDDNRRVIIATVVRPPQTVTIPTHIRGAATPTAMTADRIPPRVDTPVAVTFGGTPSPSDPVTLSIDGAGGANGSATIDGSATHAFAVTGTQIVNLRGVDQTAPGSAGNLKLVARQRGGILASSSGFSVSSIPQNISFTFNSLVTGARRGIIVDYDWRSDSGVKADLDQAEQAERIEPTGLTGIFVGGTFATSCYISSILPQQDTHSVGPVAALHGSGSATLKQTFMFKDKRAGASDIPMTNSGFLTTHVVAPKPGTGFLGFFVDFQVTTSKNAAATSASDPNPTCSSGTIASGAGTGSVTKVQDV